MAELQLRAGALLINSFGVRPDDEFRLNHAAPDIPLPPSQNPEREDGGLYRVTATPDEIVPQRTTGD